MGKWGLEWHQPTEKCLLFCSIFLKIFSNGYTLLKLFAVGNFPLLLKSMVGWFAIEKERV
jgi:hypothetical protein